MTNGTRHFGTVEGSGEEIIILGYNPKHNDILAAFPAAMTAEEAQNLRMVAQSAVAQGKDYLMDSISGNVLDGAHHPSAGVSWQTFLIRAAAGGRSSVARKLTMKEVAFADQSQKAFFGGYGASIEPDVDARRKNRKMAQEAMLAGQPLPEPVVAAPASTPAPAAPAEPAADPNAALVAALGAIVQGQNALMEKLDSLSAPAAKKPTTTRRKPAAKKKAAPTKKAAAPAPEPVVEVAEPVVDNTEGFATTDAVSE